jgi:hypothetical protein
MQQKLDLFSAKKVKTAKENPLQLSKGFINKIM